MPNLIYDLTNLGFKYNAKTTCFGGLNLRIFEGEHIAIIGPNGSGKSTLLALLAGHKKATSGSLECMKVDPHKINARERGELLSYLPQNSGARIDLSLIEFVELALFTELGRFEGISNNQKKRIEVVLDHFALTPLSSRRTTMLSGGEYQRARLARTALRKPNIILLDEPAVALDVKFQWTLWKWLSGLSLKDTVVCVVHNIDIAQNEFDRIIALDEQRNILFDGHSKDLDTNILAKLFGVEVEKFDCNGSNHWQFK